MVSKFSNSRFQNPTLPQTERRMHQYFGCAPGGHAANIMTCIELGETTKVKCCRNVLLPHQGYFGNKVEAGDCDEWAFGRVLAIFP